MAEKLITFEDLLACFPDEQYPEIRDQQMQAFRIIAQEDGNVTIEAPTGTGKTATEFTFLELLRRKGKGPLFYITPTKMLAEQAGKLHPGLYVMYGRNEFPCLYYPGENLTADPEDVPCAMLRDCAHRVDLNTGETHTPGAEPCPYLQSKHHALLADIVVCTVPFYLYTQVFSKEWDTPEGLVIDEVHRLAEIIRNSLKYDITDYYLDRCEEFLTGIDDDTAHRIADFKRVMMRIIRGKHGRKSLLTPEEIRELMNVLISIDSNTLRRKVSQAITDGTINPMHDRVLLSCLDRFVHNLGRYLSSLGYSLGTSSHAPLSYVYGFYREERDEGQKTQFRLTVRGYYVAPLIRKMLGKRTLATSATIGSPEVFGFETGIENPVHVLPSDFPASNARIFLPTDTPSLAFVSQKGTRRDTNKTLRMMLRAARRFTEHGHRSLVVLTSDDQRARFLRFCEEEHITALSYSEDESAKEVVRKFKDGEGLILVGTAAQYGEGLDLPDGLAPIIFFLKPDYPHPDDPAVQFEEQRFSRGRQWGLKKWRVMIKSLQVQGRNKRSKEDKGVCFYMSRQFRDIVPAALPEYLRPALRTGLTMDQCMEETLNLLGRR